MHLGLSLLTLFPGRVGGSETYVRGLLAAFAAGHGPERVTVLANRHLPPGYAGPLETVRVRSYRPGDSAATRLAAMLHAAARPAAAARDVPAGLDVVHQALTVPVPQVRLPTVCTLHDLHHHELPAAFSAGERLFRRWAYDGAARRADVVVTPSEHTRAGAVERLGLHPERVRVVPHGIDHERFRPGAGERAGEPFLYYPANLWPHKNHERLVAALARIESPLPLVLSGQTYGRLDALLAVAAREGVAERVRHVGHLPAAQVPATMAAATAVVIPSLAEGFGQPSLEAMACGTPVAAARAGALPEVCGDAAVLFDPRDVDAIAAALDRVVAEGPALVGPGLVQAARFTWEAAARGHVEAYRAATAVSPA